MKLRKSQIAIVGILLVILTGVAWAIDETIVVSSTAVPLTSSKYLTSSHGICKVEDNYIYFTMDGVTAPTSAGVGIRLDIGQTFEFITRQQIMNFQAIRGSSPDAKLKCTYWP